MLLRNAYPIGQAMKIWVETHFRRSTCFVVDVIDRKHLNTVVYPHLSNRSVGLRSCGEIEILGAGVFRSRALVGVPDLWEGKAGDLIPGMQAPGWKAMDLRASTHPDVAGQRRCQKCTRARGEVVF